MTEVLLDLSGLRDASVRAHDAACRVIGGDLDLDDPGVQSGHGSGTGHPLARGVEPPDESQDPETDP